MSHPRASTRGPAIIVLAVSLASVALVAAAGSSSDYMAPELRARVEQLKREVGAEPTTLETITERADVLWEWANAYAMAGGVIPNDLPLMIRSTRDLDDPEVKGLNQYAMYFDMFVRELQIKDEIPGALGILELDREEALVAEEWVSFRQTWIVGHLPMKVGGAIYLGRNGFNNHGVPQVDDPAGDNYFTITTSNPDARFVSKGIGLRQTLVTRIEGIFELEGADLTLGDTVTLTYGDRSGGSRGFRVQSYSVTNCSFPVYLEFEKVEGFLQPAWPGVEVVGKPEVSAVTVLGPSIVAPGEPFELSVRSEDDRYNRASGAAPSYEMLLNGEPHSRIPATDKALTKLAELSIDTPGVYRFSVESVDGRISGTSNPIWVRENPPYRIYWGDTHGHIGYADAQGTPDGYFSFARDDARLDFVTLSEHALWTDDREWLTLQEKAVEYHEDGRFIPILGYEWTVQPPGGHHNILYRNPWSPRVGSQSAWLLADLYRELRRRVRTDDVLSIPHAHSPGNWQISDPDIERLIEITSTHGTFEYFGNRYLSEGWEVGFIGSSDNHHEHPGLTDTGTTFHTELGGLAAVMAREKTTDAIFSAMRNIRAYATGSRRIILDAHLNGAPMGTRLPATDDRTLSCRVMGTAPIENIDVVKNGEVVYQKRHVSDEVASDTWVRVGFFSSSEVSVYDRPRNYRVWQGTIEVEGAAVKRVLAQGLENPFYESFDKVDDTTISFSIATRGRLDGLALELEGAGPVTAVRVHVEPGESGYTGVTTEVVDVDLRLADAKHGPVVHELSVAVPEKGETGRDAISLQIFDPAGSLDQVFEYTDLGERAEGDYYYLRVTQIDGEQAWSSPWWIGGEVPSAVDTVIPEENGP
jgi:hypothetical protein